MQFARPQDDLVDLYRHVKVMKVIFAAVGSYWKSFYMFSFLSSFCFYCPWIDLAKWGKMKYTVIVFWVMCNVVKLKFVLVLPYVVGQYMLMDSIIAIPGEKAWLKSPLVASSGCLDLKFHYYLFGTSKNMEISVHTMTTGRTHSLAIYEAQQLNSWTYMVYMF